MKQARKKDLASGVLFCAIGVLAMFVLIPFGVQVPSTVKIRALSPDFWPILISGAVILAALALIFEAWFMPSQPSGEDDALDSTEFELDAAPAAIRTGLLILGLFAFYLSLSTLGCCGRLDRSSDRVDAALRRTPPVADRGARHRHTDPAVSVLPTCRERPDPARDV